ncbi:MAG TPA: hypothetical protein VGK45_00260 [Thermoanaerobaculia bacterium]
MIDRGYLPADPSSPASRRPIPRRLSFRLAVALALGAGAILLATGAWNFHLQRRHLTRLVEAQDGLVIISARLDADAGRVCLQVEDTGRPKSFTSSDTWPASATVRTSNA